MSYLWLPQRADSARTLLGQLVTWEFVPQAATLNQQGKEPVDESFA